MTAQEVKISTKINKERNVRLSHQLSDTVNTRGLYVGCVPYLPLGVVCDGHVEGADRTTVLPNTAVGHWQTNETRTTLRTILRTVHCSCYIIQIWRKQAWDVQPHTQASWDCPTALEKTWDNFGCDTVPGECLGTWPEGGYLTIPTYLYTHHCSLAVQVTPCVLRTQPDWREVVTLCHVHTHLQHSIH